MTWGAQASLQRHDGAYRTEELRILREPKVGQVVDGLTVARVYDGIRFHPCPNCGAWMLPGSPQHALVKGACS